MKINTLIIALFVFAFTATTAQAQDTPISRHQKTHKTKISKKDNVNKEISKEATAKRKAYHKNKLKRKGNVEKQAAKTDRKAEKKTDKRLHKEAKANGKFYRGKKMKAKRNTTGQTMSTKQRKTVKANRKLYRGKTDKVDQKAQPKKAHKSRKDYEPSRIK